MGKYVLQADQLRERHTQSSVFTEPLGRSTDASGSVQISGYHDLATNLISYARDEQRMGI